MNERLLGGVGVVGSQGGGPIIRLRLEGDSGGKPPIDVWTELTLMQALEILRSTRSRVATRVRWRQRVFERIRHHDSVLAMIPPAGVASQADLTFIDAAIPQRTIASHSNWSEYLSPRLNRSGVRVLEVGSRAVNSNGVFRRAFPECDFVGLDIHPGLNVDVVGDAHRLSDYFEPDSFDAVVSSAVFEHLALPWIVAEEISRVLRPGGLLYVETHFSHSMHELPWNFFQFSHKGLEALFNARLGFEVIESGVSNPIVGRFSQAADDYLVGQQVVNLYCHAGILARKRLDYPASDGALDWRAALTSIYQDTEYPRHTSAFESGVPRTG